ncbi:Protein DOM34 [Nakaseomyces glabratus]|nr:Protein DOM34 [Nakaseomyces glabratus]KTB26210.1 Protein DOM34 [Nakaseomyces glabratus]
MKIISITKDSANKEGATIVLLPEDKEDLFTVHQIIDKDDEVIFKKKFTTNLDEAGKKKSTDLVKLRLKIVSSEFEMRDEYLRYKGVTVADDNGNSNVDIPVGKFLSFTVNYSFPFTIIKQNFDSFMEKTLQNAANPESRSDTAAIVLQEGIAHVCLLTASSTILKQKIEYSMPKKKRATDVMKFDEKTEKFYKAIYESIKKYYDFSKIKLILLCSPGFYAKTLLEKIIQYAQEERNKSIIDHQSLFLVAHCSTGYLQGINEVLKNPLYSTKLSDTKYAKDAAIMDEFMEHLNNDDFKAWYGEAEVEKAAEMGAIKYLLITDTMLHNDDIKKRKKFLALYENVESSGGKGVVFSTLHSLGEELDRMTGVACILNYPLPDLDEDLEDEESENDNEFEI